MVSFLESLGEQIQNRWCTLQTEDIILGGLIAAGSGVGTPALAIAGVVGVARNASDQICDKATPTPPAVASNPSFTGGQCDGYIYTGVTAEYSFVNFVGQTENSGIVGVTGTYTGRITSAAISIKPQVGGTWRIVATITDQNGTSERTLQGQPLNAGSLLSSVINFPSQPNGNGDCGEPPPEFDPLEEYDDVIDDVPFDDENGNPVNFPDLPIKWFPPCVGLDGLKVPFEITTPLGKICGQVQLKPDIKSGVKPKVDFDLCPSERQDLEQVVPEKMKDYFELSDEIGSIASPFPSSDYGNIPTLQADNEKPILGIFIECGTDGTESGKATKIFNSDDGSDAPTLFVPRLGYVRFWMLAEREEADAVQWSLPIEIKQPRAFIPCPSPFGALAVDVQMLDGYSAKYKVAKRKTCCEACEQFDPNAPNDALDRCN